MTNVVGVAVSHQQGMHHLMYRYSNLKTKGLHLENFHSENFASEKLRELKIPGTELSTAEQSNPARAPAFDLLPSTLLKAHG